jgi:hypothetical protein
VVKDIQDLARQKTPQAIAALEAALEKPGERVAAAGVLLAYAYGRPIQRQDMRVIRSLADLSTEELLVLAGRDVEDGEEEAAGRRH